MANPTPYQDLAASQGSSIIIGGVAPPIVIPVGRWSGSWKLALLNVPQADVPGADLFFPQNQQNSWAFRTVYDMVNFPTVVGLAPGNIISQIYFGYYTNTVGGIVTMYGDSLLNTTVEEVNPEIDIETGDVVRITVKGKGGYLLTNASVSGTNVPP